MTEQEPQEAPAWKRALVAALAAFGLIMVMTAASIVFAWLEARERGGQVTRVAAPSEPLKVRPEDPGGQEVEFLDLEALNEAQVTYERLLPPDERPDPESLAPPPPPPAPEPPGGSGADFALGGDAGAGATGAPSFDGADNLSAGPAPVPGPTVAKGLEAEIEEVGAVAEETLGRPEHKSITDILSEVASVDQESLAPAPLAPSDSAASAGAAGEGEEGAADAEAAAAEEGAALLAAISAQGRWVVQLASLTSQRDAEGAIGRLQRAHPGLLQPAPGGAGAGGAAGGRVSGGEQELLPGRGRPVDRPR